MSVIAPYWMLLTSIPTEAVHGAPTLFRGRCDF